MTITTAPHTNTSTVPLPDKYAGLDVPVDLGPPRRRRKPYIPPTPDNDSILLGALRDIEGDFEKRRALALRVPDHLRRVLLITAPRWDESRCRPFTDEELFDLARWFGVSEERIASAPAEGAAEAKRYDDEEFGRAIGESACGGAYRRARTPSARGCMVGILRAAMRSAIGGTVAEWGAR